MNALEDNADLPTDGGKYSHNMHTEAWRKHNVSGFAKYIGI